MRTLGVVEVTFPIFDFLTILFVDE